MIPSLFYTKEQLHGRQFFHGLGWGEWFQDDSSQVHQIYYALYFYFYYVISTLSVWNRLSPLKHLSLTQNSQERKENNFSPCSFLSFCKEREPFSKAAPTHDCSSVSSAGTWSCDQPRVVLSHWKKKLNSHDWLWPIKIQPWGWRRKLSSWACCYPGIREHNPCLGWVQLCHRGLKAVFISPPCYMPTVGQQEVSAHGYPLGVKLMEAPCDF